MAVSQLVAITCYLQLGWTVLPLADDMQIIQSVLLSDVIQLATHKYVTQTTQWELEHSEDNEQQKSILIKGHNHIIFFFFFWYSAVHNSRSMTPITWQVAVDDEEQRPLLQDILEAAVDDRRQLTSENSGHSCKPSHYNL